MVESHKERMAGWHGCTVVVCKGATGGLDPVGGSPEGQPACLKWKKKMEVQVNKTFNDCFVGQKYYKFRN